MSRIQLRVGDKKIDWAQSAAHVSALAATMSYRLEPNGVGSRFPILMDGFNTWTFSSEQFVLALQELTIVSKEMQELAPGKAVATVTGAERINPEKTSVNLSAQNAYELFVNRDGVPMLQALEQSLKDGMASQQVVDFLAYGMTKALTGRLIGALLMLIGFGRAILYVFFTEKLAPFHPERLFISCLMGTVGVFALVSPLSIFRTSSRKMMALALIVSMVLFLILLFVRAKRML